jgi:hypothetical protein
MEKKVKAEHRIDDGHEGQAVEGQLCLETAKRIQNHQHGANENLPIDQRPSNPPSTNNSTDQRVQYPFAVRQYQVGRAAIKRLKQQLEAQGASKIHHIAPAGLEMYTVSISLNLDCGMTSFVALKYATMSQMKVHKPTTPKPR